MTDEAVTAVRAPERLTVESAGRLLDELAAATEDHDTVRVDLGQIAAIDTAGLQLLLVLKQSLNNRGGSCALEQAPPIVVEHARLLGLDGWLDLA